MKVVAIMPIKLNNERLPGKNTMLLGDKPLLQYELDNLKQVTGIDEIYVYCSNESVCQYLPQGIHFLKRSKELDLPTSNFTQIFTSFKNEIDADIYIYAHATAPYVKVSTMQKCLDSVKLEGYDSAFCATVIQDYLWQNGKPLNFDATNLPRSQDLEPIYRETSGVYVFSKEMFNEYRRRVGINPYIAPVSFKESIDINNKEDFKLAKMWLSVED